MSTGNWGRWTENCSNPVFQTAKSWQGAGCPRVLPLSGNWITPELPCPPSLCCLWCCRGGGWWCGTHHMQNYSGDLEASASPQEKWGTDWFPLGRGEAPSDVGLDKSHPTSSCLSSQATRDTGKISPCDLARVQSLSNICSTGTAWNNTSWTSKISPGWKLFSFSFFLRTEQHKNLPGQKWIMEEKEQLKFWTL